MCLSKSRSYGQPQSCSSSEVVIHSITDIHCIWLITDMCIYCNVTAISSFLSPTVRVCVCVWSGFVCVAGCVLWYVYVQMYAFVYMRIFLWLFLYVCVNWTLKSTRSIWPIVCLYTCTCQCTCLYVYKCSWHIQILATINSPVTLPSEQC